MEGSDEFCEIFCEPCEKAQQQTIAEGFCVDCSEYLCGQCFNHHKRFKLFEHHVLQDKNSMPLDPKHIVSKYVCTSKCQVHADEVTKYICKTCDKIGCNVCMTIDHRSCDGVKYIPDEVKKAETSAEIQEFAKMIDDMIEEQTKLYVKIDQNFQVSDEMNKTACNELERQKDQIVTFFENLYDKIKTEVVGKQDADKNVFKTLLKEIRIMQTDLKNRKARLQTLEQGQQICEAFIFMKYTQAAMGKMSSDVKILSKNGKEKPARYQPSLDVEELKEDFKCLGRLLTGESDQITQIESVKKKMEKELHMTRLEKQDLQDVLDRTKAISEDLKKNVTELQSRIQKEEQNNKYLKTEKENQKLDYESRYYLFLFI
ncbi:E3 ubiquitin-protein ligase TRIM71-like [Ruditapes philippinarum]|uniref:E3 ubiquitin-protein ligase TRIM71-like n=1 Tax=Ruditapes philippinarum TaxID=129788 RepID=UPI00295BAB2F|nr:E3 ubiquitin-protein ligase TRIM71-like [Ruditapes philippinarum]